MPVMVRFAPETYLPLTPAMFQVLVALADGDKHGYAVIKEVSRRTDGQVRLRTATLYTVLRRFVDEGPSARRRAGPIRRSTTNAAATTSSPIAAGPWRWPRPGGWPRRWPRRASSWGCGDGEADPRLAVAAAAARVP
jgi:Transcriptional regulator PadR-like family